MAKIRKEEPLLIYDNGQIWLFSKPPGLAVQGGKGVTENLESFIQEQMFEKPYLVHRLDKETSGLILVAKNPAAASKYSQLLHSRQVEKRYKALVQGRFPSKMEMETPIMVQGKLMSAHTSAKLVSHHKGFSLVSLTLHTGRTHQIRIHLQQAGFPIVGDSKYGNFDLNRKVKKEMDLDRLMLDASQLVIRSEKIDFALPLPQDFNTFIKHPALKGL